MIEPEVMSRIRALVEELATFEYPRVWIGEMGMTPDEYLIALDTDREMRREMWEAMSPEERKEAFGDMPLELRERTSDEVLESPPEKWDELPNWLQEALKHPLEVEPDESVGVEGAEGAGIRVPKIGYEYLDGLWVIENLRDRLDEETAAQLHREVLYIYAAKRGEVPLYTDFRERMLANLPLDIRRVPIDELTQKDLDDGRLRFDELEFYATDSWPPYVIEDTEQVRTALDERLDA